MYKCYRISELGEVVGGGTPSTKNENFWGGSIPWITPKDLAGYTSVYISKGENNITEAGLRSGSKLLPKDTVLITSRAPIGYIALANNPISTNQGFKSIICNQGICKPLYLYYYLKCNTPYLRLFGSGATFPEISGTVMKKIKLNIIEDVRVQDKLAHILKVYDDLIEKNNRKIEILQEMAEELYKEWFIRFRFPGYKDIKKKDSTLGMIPECFKITKMSEIFENYIGGGWGNDDESNQYSVPAYVIRGTDFPSITKGKISTCPYRWHKENNYKSRQLKVNDIIIEISGGTAEQPVGRAILIDDNLIKRFDNKVICASFCKQVSLKQDKVSPIYFYYWMKFLYDTRMIDRFQLQSTGIINFKFEYFVRKGDVLLPPKPLMDKFDNIVATIRKDISLLAEQNENLIQQRDLLLPRLMSGKLEVKGDAHA